MYWFIWLLLIVIISLIVLKLSVKLTTGWCTSQVCLVGKTAIVTGGNAGLGYETAIDLAKRGARVILACRDEKKAKEAVKSIIKETDNLNVCYKILDLASLKSVREFADEIIKTEPKLDILINNAGAYALTGKSEDGLNMLMQVNYFGHFLLTNLLLDLLKKSGPSRIINVSSLAAKEAKPTEPLNINNLNDPLPDREQYRVTKLCNILFTVELNSKLQGTKVTTYSLHPGVIVTEILRTFCGYQAGIFYTILRLFLKDSVEGAQTTIYCAVQKGIEELSGEHFHDCHFVQRYKAVDDGLAKKLWEKSEQHVNLVSSGTK